jgi:predicted dehydrogenase
MGWPPGAEAYDRDWRTRWAIAGGGCLLDNGYHAVYLAEDLLGPVTSVVARVGTCTRDIEVDDTALLLCTHEGGGTSSLQVAWSAGGQSTRVNELHGNSGTLRLDPDGHVALSLGDDWERQSAAPEPGFLGVFRLFLDALDGKGPLPTTAREAVQTLRVVRAAYASAATGQPVDVRSYEESA